MSLKIFTHCSFLIAPSSVEYKRHQMQRMSDTLKLVWYNMPYL